MIATNTPVSISYIYIYIYILCRHCRLPMKYAEMVIIIKQLQVQFKSKPIVDKI